MTLALNYIGISNSAGLKPVDAKLSAYTVIAGSMFVTDNSAGVTYTLPASARLGSVFEIVGKTGSWKIAQGNNQQILFNSQASTLGTGGSLNSTSNSDCVTLTCITPGAATVWRVTSSEGSPTVV